MAADGGGSKSSGGDGGVVAATVIVPLLVIGLTVAVTVVVIFLVVRYRRTKSVDIQSIPKSFENALYAGMCVHVCLFVCLSLVFIACLSVTICSVSHSLTFSQHKPN